MIPSQYSYFVTESSSDSTEEKIKPKERLPEKRVEKSASESAFDESGICFRLFS